MNVTDGQFDLFAADTRMEKDDYTFVPSAELGSVAVSTA